MKPLISIVIPTYNRARDLERALRSVLVQTYPYWEALVVDNHSSDNTRDAVENFNDARIRLLSIHNNGVIAASRNLGIRCAQGQYIAFLDSDDWWSPEKVDESLKYLEQGADVVYHDLFLVTKPDQRFFWRKAYTRDLVSPVFNDLIANGNGLTNSSVVVRKELLNAIGGLLEDRRLISAEDYVAWLKISKLTEKFRRIPKTLGYYWAGGGNVSNPDRTLISLGAIEERYASSFVDSKVWLCYAKGRAYYRSGRYEMAKKSLEPISWKQSSLLMYVNSYRILLSICLRHYLKSIF